ANPIGALAMAATAVERAFKAWSTGEYEVGKDSFSASAWTNRTALYVADIERIDSRGWRKIMERAKAVLERGKKAILPPNMSANQILPKPDSRRYKVVDADTSD
ncbi:hypothetical protein BD779DRAFT_1481167, partial [Infundibulicybe gibba]